MTNDQRKIEQMKLFRLWKSGKIPADVYASETTKLLQKWAVAHYGKKRAS